MIYGERVRHVREMHRLTQSDLAALMPTLTQSQLSRIESGFAQPDEETISLLAATLGVLVSFFEKPPVADLVAHSPQLRARNRLTSTTKTAAMQWARLIDEEYERLKVHAKQIPIRLEPLHDTPPSDAARAVRRLLGFGDVEPLPYLLLGVERLGVTVLGLPFHADALDAFCAWRDSAPIICLLPDVPGDRLRWNVAHEIGHLVLHKRGKVGRDVEAEADEFAAELLTPRAVIAEWMPRTVTLQTLTMLKTQWGVSVKSLVRRAREVGRIDADRAVGLYKQISSRGWNRSEPGYVPVEKPRAFRKLIEIVYGPGPNLERYALDAGWSQELTTEIVKRFAAADELPLDPRPERDVRLTASNVVPFRPRHANGSAASRETYLQ